MSTLLLTLNITAALLTGLFLLALITASVREREYRGAGISLVLFLTNGALWGFFIGFPVTGTTALINKVVLGAFGALGILSLLRFFPSPVPPRDLTHLDPYDERDHMFSRNHLQFTPELAKEYYGARPEREAIDRRIHRQPELGEPGSQYHDPAAGQVFHAAFDYLHRSIPLARGEPPGDAEKSDPSMIRTTLVQAARYYGAADVGFTRLRRHHLYSHHGRQPGDWGKPVANSHQSAMVILVPMSVAMIKKAPSLSVIEESARQYVQVGVISNLLAGILRRFGCEARAHNDGNYEVICVPLAIDAGLGELGRFGSLIHPVYGPCVRLAAVTTDLDLGQSPVENHRIGEFCRTCKKCADNCPGGAIFSGEEPVSRGFPHWSVRQENCFGYWKKIGSDCGVCIAVCPYTKPDTLIHRLIRFYISRNPVNQAVALFFDDLMYGRKYPIQEQNSDPVFIDSPIPSRRQP